MQRGVYLWQNSKLATLIQLFLLCLVRFSVKGPRDAPTTQHWVPASETQASPEWVVGLCCCWLGTREWGGLSYQLLCWVTLDGMGQMAESNLETIRSAGELVLQFYIFFFSPSVGQRYRKARFKWSWTCSPSSTLNSRGKSQKSIWKQSKSA